MVNKLDAPTGSLDARAIQRALNAKGAQLAEDGALGPASRSAIYAAVQACVGGVAAPWSAERLRLAFEQIMLRDAGLYRGAIDGLAGPATRAALGKWGKPALVVPVAAAPASAPPSFAGAARRITEADIAAAARSIGCEVAALHAVMDVESRGSGYDGRGCPVILFEPHVFYRQLAKLPSSTYDACLNRAVLAGLAYAHWRKGNYPGGSALEQSDGNYARLSRAIAIHEECAYRAISIGMGQVLGENFEAAGAASAVEMFAAAKESEAAQLGHMLGYIKHAQLDDDIRARNWETFARGYNGSGQVVMYADKLGAQFKKWSKRAA
ncbi:N-acetylmuramidase family protein [Methylosinus sp. PW1]|uniref:N-acetylmuramidase domain-containing protein n=1 Tax=Methylosinus sp. PW1 TaxID=107636 RepID=UPI000690D633|nr:N-acetylmuramidase family protein [Methylosinus sp. PW1]